MSASRWVSDINEAVRVYAGRRRLARPVVKVTLANGDFRYARGAAAGETDFLVSLDVYGDPGDHIEVERAGPDGSETIHETREVLVVHPSAIAKVELLPEYPGPGDFGFRAPDAD